MRKKVKRWAAAAGPFLLRHKWQVLGLILVAFWCLPYFTLGNRIEWGDFSFLAQSYEAMRVQIVHYHQFPWWNPWESGGVPLYADPQMGLFSIQMLLTFVVGAPIALQLTVALFTFLGYGSMLLLLRRYFNVSTGLSILLSLLWVFGSFFVAHLPSHFTFIWYLLAPFYVYLALTVKTWRGGLGMGAAYGVMALAAVHNAFFHITLVCGIILAARLVLEQKRRPELLKGLVAATVVFGVLAGHRVLYAMQYVRGVHRTVADPAANVLSSLSGSILPYSRAHHIALPYPDGIYGFGEMSGTIGLFASTAALICFIYLIGQWRKKGKRVLVQYLPAWIVLAFVIGCLSLALGSFFRFAPYAFLKHVPVFSNMRVPTRWYLWMDLGLLVFIGVVATKLPQKLRLHRAVRILLVLGVAEMLILNWNYQPTILAHQVVRAPEPSYNYQFVQMRQFGETRRLPGGKTIPDSYHTLPHPFGEYEATLFNVGVIEANNVLVDVRGNPDVKRCSYAAGCDFVLSGNAEVTYWSPERIVLKRTASGPISLNINNSDYFVVNGARQATAGIAEPLRDFVITVPDTTPQITIEVKPSLIRHKLL